MLVPGNGIQNILETRVKVVLQDILFYAIQKIWIVRSPCSGLHLACTSFTDYSFWIAGMSERLCRHSHARVCSCMDWGMRRKQGNQELIHSMNAPDVLNSTKFLAVRVSRQQAFAVASEEIHGSYTRAIGFLKIRRISDVSAACFCFGRRMERFYRVHFRFLVQIFERTPLQWCGQDWRLLKAASATGSHKKRRCYREYQ